MLHLERTQSPQSKTAKTAPKVSGEVFGTLVNLSGRRRFTSQRVVLYALLAAQGREGAMAASHEALAAFKQAHAALVDGSDRLPGVFCDELREAYFGAPAGDKTIRDFVALAERALDAIATNGRGAPALLDRLVESGTPLLAVLNSLTQLYDDLARRQATLARKQLVGVMGDIESISKQAHIVAFNAQIIAARAGESGREFSIVAGELSRITGRIDELVREALRASVA